MSAGDGERWGQTLFLEAGLVAEGVALWKARGSRGPVEVVSQRQGSGVVSPGGGDAQNGGRAADSGGRAAAKNN